MWISFNFSLKHVLPISETTPFARVRNTLWFLPYNCLKLHRFLKNTPDGFKISTSTAHLLLTHSCGFALMVGAQLMAMPWNIEVSFAQTNLDQVGSTPSGRKLWGAPAPRHHSRKHRDKDLWVPCNLSRKGSYSSLCEDRWLRLSRRNDAPVLAVR